jgi:3',5'-cyclic AMP phosphodiesterase CpdA
MADKLLASILHLSDPHLGKSFDYPAQLLQQLTGSAGQRVTPKRLRSAISRANFARGLKLQSGPFVALPHDQTVLRAVFRGIDGAQLQLCDRYDRFAGFDLVVVSGDILTEPFSVSSYDTFAYRWLTGSLTDAHGNLIGLKLPADRIVAIPGNHDRFHEVDDTIYSQSQIATQMPVIRGNVEPSQPGLRSYCAEFTTAGGGNLHFIGVDSNQYGDKTTLARGDISDDHIDAIVNYSKRITDPTALLVVALHHPPYKLTLKKHGLQNAIGSTLRIAAWDMELRNAERFCEKVGPMANMVIYGHLHFSEIWQDERDRGAVFAQAPTTVEIGDEQQGFNIYLLFQDARGDIGVEVWQYLYDDDTTSFRRVGAHRQKPLDSRP